MLPVLARWWRILPVAVVLVFPFRSSLADEPKPSPEALEFFEKKIRPLLVNNCYNCHSADNKAAGGLRVDDRNGLLAGGGRGAAVVVGNPDESVLIRAILKTDAKLKMALSALWASSPADSSFVIERTGSPTLPRF